MSKRAERRRESRTASQGKSSSNLNWILGGVALLALLVVAWNLVSSLLDDAARQPVALEFASSQELLELAQGIERGNPDANVTIIEFADYQCPACQAFFQQTKPFLEMTYVEQGDARFVFYDFPLSDIHAHAFLAARAARCADDQDRYWDYHDRLFQMQASWASQSDPLSDFVNYAQELGLNQDAFRSCLRSDRHADVVTANQMLGEQLGVQGTPTVMVDTGSGNAVRVSDWTINGIRAVVDPVLGTGEGMEEGDAS